MLKIAIVGMGDVATHHYLPFLRDQGDVELGLHSRDQEKARRLAEAFGAKHFSTIDDLAGWNPTATLVLTSEKVRYEIAWALIEAGVKRIFCEKPLVAAKGQAHVSEDDFCRGRRLLAFARESQCEMAMNFNYRFFDQTLLAKEIARSRCFGSVIQVAMLTHYACWSHCIDLLHFFAGKCMEITGLSGGVERHGQGIEACDRAAAFRMESGAVGTLIGTSGLKWRHPLFEAIFTFESGRIHMRDIDGDLEVLDGASHTHERISRGRDASRWDDYGSSFKKALSAYLTSLKAGTQPPVPGVDGLRELQFEAALGRSVMENRPVDVQGEFPLF